MIALGLPGLLPPAASRQRALGQWHTPDNVALRLARWCGAASLPRVLEPSAGGGALVRAIRETRAAAQIDAVELDPSWADKLRAAHSDDSRVSVECGDYLARPSPATRYDAVIMNPPYEDGADGLFLARAMEDGDRVIALVRLATLAGQARHERVWSRIDAHDDGWWMPGLAVFSARPNFLAAGEDVGGGKTDFAAIKLSRVGTPAATHVEWW